MLRMSVAPPYTLITQLRTLGPHAWVDVGNIAVGVGQ